MCGIAGELRFDGAAPEPATLKRMVARLARRGRTARVCISTAPPPWATGAWPSST
jgi:asparagine synthetase B (glutamine-hydrolysing)